MKKAIEILKNGGVILYPTDTIWGIGCDATSEVAVNKIFKIKQRSESKSLIVLVDSLSMLQNYVKKVPKEVIKILQNSISPTTIIYQNPKGLAKNVVAADNTVAIRIVSNDFCKQLINIFGKPIVSTSANVSNNPTPKSFKEIELAILDSVDYVVNLQNEVENKKSSTILKVAKSGEITILRK